MPTTRRSFLRNVSRATVAWAALGATGLVALARTTGYEIDWSRAGSLKALSPWQLTVVDALADRVLVADVPYDAPGAPPTPREVGVSEFFDSFVAASEPAIRRDLLAAVSAVEHAVPLLAGEVHRFTALSPDKQDAVLAKMEASSSGLLRGAFQGLKSLLMMGYWRDPRTWGVIGYDGPLVARPAGGWTQLRYKP